MTLLFLLTACGPSAKVAQNFNGVVYFNGVNKYEAVAIAEMKLIKSVFAPYYQSTEAKIRADQSALKHPNTWFVDFSQGLLFDSPSYLVAINKDDGRILYAGEYFPKKLERLDWVFDRAKYQNTK